MLFAGPAIEEIGEPGVEVDLHQDRHGQQGDHHGLRDDLFPLKPEQKDQRCQKRDQ